MISDGGSPGDGRLSRTRGHDAFEIRNSRVGSLTEQARIHNLPSRYFMPSRRAAARCFMFSHTERASELCQCPWRYSVPCVSSNNGTDMKADSKTSSAIFTGTYQTTTMPGNSCSPFPCPIPYAITKYSYEVHHWIQSIRALWHYVAKVSPQRAPPTALPPRL